MVCPSPVPTETTELSDDVSSSSSSSLSQQDLYNGVTGNGHLPMTATSTTTSTKRYGTIPKITNRHMSMDDSEKTTQTTTTNDTLQTMAGVAGNILEWYDFAVFGYFGDVIGDVFFPPHQKGHAALVESFAVFGGAFLMRPIGGILMGHIGDKYSRKTALEISIFLMAIPTFLMGLLPSYAAIGYPAILLLTIVRLLQGLSVGGQMMSSLVFTVENSPRRMWGLYGSFVMAAANFGTLLGGVVGYVVRGLLGEEAVRAWGWRVPFLAGILVSVSGVYLRYYCKDDEGGQRHHGGDKMTPPHPLRVALQPSNRRSLVSSCLVPLIWSSGFYLSFVWMAIYMNDLLQPPLPQAFAINSLALLSSVVLFFPIAGYLSDLYGRIKIMLIGGVGMLLYPPVAIHFIGRGVPAVAYVAQTILGLVLSLWGSPMLAWLVESFEPEARLTSVSIGFNVAQALGAGMGPGLATVMVDQWGPQSPGYLLSAFAVCGLVGLAMAPGKVDKKPFGDVVKPLMMKEKDTDVEQCTATTDMVIV